MREVLPLIDLNLRNCDGQTHLHVAALVVSNMVVQLLEMNAKADPRSDSGETPFGFTCRLNRKDVVKVFVEANVKHCDRTTTPLIDLNGANCDGETTCQLALPDGLWSGQFDYEERRQLHDYVKLAIYDQWT